MSTIDIITNQQFVIFITNVGLAVFLVLYFVIIRDPKHIQFWQNEYSELDKSYKQLNESYKKLFSAIHKRPLNKDEAKDLCFIGLDRDLYKLYTLTCWKIDGESHTHIKNFISHTVHNTNGVWSRFSIPLANAEHITDCLDIYNDGGSAIIKEIDEIVNKDIPDEQKKREVWNALLNLSLTKQNQFCSLVG